MSGRCAKGPARLRLMLSACVSAEPYSSTSSPRSWTEGVLDAGQAVVCEGHTYLASAQLRVYSIGSVVDGLGLLLHVVNT